MAYVKLDSEPGYLQKFENHILLSLTTLLVWNFTTF